MFTQLSKALFKRNRVNSVSVRLVCRFIAGWLVFICIAIFAIKMSSDALNTFNQYIPVDKRGAPIEVIPGHVEHMTEDEVASWVEDCALKALSFSPISYQNDFSRFSQKCLQPSKISEWGQTLEDAGYMTLIKGGSILEFVPKKVELIYKKVVNGRLHWRYEVSGTLIRAVETRSRTSVTLDILVTRQDPFNYENAIAIARIVL